MAVQLTPIIRRSGESSNQSFVRCGRFIHRNSIWYFKTREGIDYGPVQSQTECKYAYEEFLDIVANQTDLHSVPIDFKGEELNFSQDQESPLDSDWKIPNISFF